MERNNLTKLDKLVVFRCRLFKLKRACNEYKHHCSGESYGANGEEDISASILFHKSCIGQQSGLCTRFEIAILQSDDVMHEES